MAFNKYHVIKNAVSYDLANFIFNYFLLKRDAVQWMYQNNITYDNGMLGTWTDKQIPNTYSCYGDFVMDTLLVKMLPVMKQHTGLDLIPTYSYTRAYKKGDCLHRHKDRPSCEISTTLNLGGDPWPIFIEPSGKKDKKGKELFSKYLQTLKEDNNLRNEYLIYKNLTSVKFNNDTDAKYFISENIQLLKNNDTTKGIKKLQSLIEGFDIVVGKKELPRRWDRKLLTIASRLWIKVLFGLDVDTQTGLKGFNYKPGWKTDGWAVDSEILHKAQQLGKTMTEIPVHAIVSSGKSIRDILLTLKDTITIRLGK